MLRFLDYSVQNTDFIRSYIQSIQNDIKNLQNQIKNRHHQEQNQSKIYKKFEQSPRISYSKNGENKKNYFNNQRSSITKHNQKINYFEVIPKQENSDEEKQSKNKQNSALQHPKNIFYRNQGIIEKIEKKFESQVKRNSKIICQSLVNKIEGSSEAQVTSSEIEFSSSKFEVPSNSKQKNFHQPENQEKMKKTPTTIPENSEILKQINPQEDSFSKENLEKFSVDLQSLRESIINWSSRKKKLDQHINTVKRKQSADPKIKKSRHSEFKVSKLKKQNFFYFEAVFKHFLDHESNQNLSTQYKKSLKNFLRKIYRKKTKNVKKGQIKDHFLKIFYMAIQNTEKKLFLNSEKQPQPPKNFPQNQKSSNFYRGESEFKFKIIRSSCDKSLSNETPNQNYNNKICESNENFQILGGTPDKELIKQTILGFLKRSIWDLPSDCDFKKLFFDRINEYIQKIEKRKEITESRLSSISISFRNSKKNIQKKII